MEDRGSGVRGRPRDIPPGLGRARPERERAPEAEDARDSPSPKPSRGARRPPREAPDRWRENLPNSLPLLFIGIASFAICVVLFQMASTFHPTRLPLWMLAFSIGLVSTVGGGAALLFGDFREEEDEGFAAEALRSGRFVLVPREEYWRVKVLLRRREKETSWREDEEEGAEGSSGAEKAADAPRGPKGPEPPLEEVERWLDDIERAVPRSRPTAPSLPTPAPPVRLARSPSDGRRPRAAHRGPVIGGRPVGQDQVRQEYERLLGELNRVGAGTTPPAQAATIAPGTATAGRCPECGVRLPPPPDGPTCAVCLSAVCGPCGKRGTGPDGRLLCPACRHLIDASGG